MDIRLHLLRVESDQIIIKNTPELNLNKHHSNGDQSGKITSQTMQKSAMRPPPVTEQPKGATRGHHDAVAVPIAEANAFST
jgi:hypothetical protein